MKGVTMGATQDKIIIKKNGVSMTLTARTIQNNSMMFYLKVKRYAPEGQEALINVSEKKNDTSDEKEECRKKLSLSSEMEIKVVHKYSHLGEKLFRTTCTLLVSS